MSGGAEPAILSLKQVCDLLGIHVNTGLKLAARGELPGQLPRVGKLYRFNREAVERYLSGETGSAA